MGPLLFFYGFNIPLDVKINNYVYQGLFWENQSC